MSRQSQHEASVHARSTDIVFWGTYDLSKPRTRILLRGLEEIGTSIHQVHAEIWPKHADKSQMNMRAMLSAFFFALLSYPGLVVRFLRTPRNATVFVPYLGALDVIVIWPFARIRGQRVVWDMFLSLYDTVVNDRQMISRYNPAALALYGIEWLAARLAYQVLLDTRAHADYVARLFGLPAGKTDAVPVGAELEKFPRLDAPKPHGGPTRVLFYGQLIPLHGVETILKAAVTERGKQIHWRLIGTGQDRHKIEKALGDPNLSHLIWDQWVEYDELIDAIRGADICLGIFGSSDKAASVVPNKVYQTLFSGRHVITRDSPAMTEILADAPGLTLIPHSDPEALLDAIDQVGAEGYPVIPLQKLGMLRPVGIAQTFRQIVTENPEATG